MKPYDVRSRFHRSLTSGHFLLIVLVLVLGLGEVVFTPGAKTPFTHDTNCTMLSLSAGHGNLHGRKREI